LGFSGKFYRINSRCAANPENLGKDGALHKGGDHHFIVFGLGRMKKWSTVVRTKDRDSSNGSVEILFDQPILIYLVHELVGRQHLQGTDVQVECGMHRPRPLMCLLEGDVDGVGRKVRYVEFQYTPNNPFENGCPIEVTVIFEAHPNKIFKSRAVDRGPLIRRRDRAQPCSVEPVYSNA
jgi:hypothetical protein